MLQSEQIAERWLLMLGAVPGYKGYRYLLKSVCLIIEDAEPNYHISGRLYKRVAMLYGTSPSNVEKGIARLIKSINWTKKKLELINLGSTGEKLEPPTSAKLITLLSCHVAIERRLAKRACGEPQKKLLRGKRSLLR